MKSKVFLLFVSILLLSSCQLRNSNSFDPPVIPLMSPTVTITSTPAATPTPKDTIMPSAYPTLDAGTLPSTLQEFLGRYASFEEMNANIQKDYHFIAVEVNRRPSGTRDTSPLLALEQGITDCYETAVISALFGEKFGYKPYLLILEHPVFSKKQPHSLHVFQDPITGLWGYNDYMLELKQPVYLTIEDLADSYIKSHPVEGMHYDFWSLVDLSLVDTVYGIDWRTTAKNLRIREKIVVENGAYMP